MKLPELTIADIVARAEGDAEMLGMSIAIEVTTRMLNEAVAAGMITEQTAERMFERMGEIGAALSEELDDMDVK